MFSAYSTEWRDCNKSYLYQNVTEDEHSVGVGVTTLSVEVQEINTCKWVSNVSISMTMLFRKTYTVLLDGLRRQAALYSFLTF